MIGALDHQLHALKSAYLRALLFNNDARIYFYSTLREYVRSRFPLLRLFNDIQQQNESVALKEIARLSKTAIRNHEPFATHYRRSGLFTEHEAVLLTLGERHDCMDTVTGLLLDQDTAPPALAQILGPSLQWIIMTLLMTLMAVYIAPSMARHTEGYPLFFTYTTYIETAWPQLLIALFIAILLYRTALYRLTGPARTCFMLLGCFRVHALVLERQFLKIAGALIQAQLPPHEFLQLMEMTFSKDRPFALAVHKSRSRLKEASLLDILKDLLSPQAYRHVLACAPNRTPDEIGQGFAMAARMLDIRLAKIIKTVAGLYTGLFLITSIAITVPFAFVSMGMGVTL